MTRGVIGAGMGHEGRRRTRRRAGSAAARSPAAPTNAPPLPWPSRGRARGQAPCGVSVIQNAPRYAKPAMKEMRVSTDGGDHDRPAAGDRRSSARSRARHPRTDAGCRCTGDRTGRRSSRTAAGGRTRSRRAPAAVSKAAGPLAAAISQQTSRIVPDRQGHAGDAMQDRQDRGELGLVDLQMRRKRAVCHGLMRFDSVLAALQRPRLRM